MTERVVVVGGGIAGLAAAHSLARHFDVVLLEADAQLGGKLQSTDLAGAPVDLGPDAFITRQPAAEELCIELGLGEEMVAPSANSVAMYTRGELRRLPKGVVLGVPTSGRELVRSGVLSAPSALRAASDLLRWRPVVPADALARARTGGDDRSVEAIFGQRLGSEVVRTLIDPLLGGINASDVSVLSLAASAPQLLGRIAGKRSVMRALRAEPATFRSGGKPPFLGLERGIGSLVDALAKRAGELGADLRTSSAVSRIERDGARWRVRVGDELIEADAVLLATPGFVSARLLEALDADLAAELGAIPYSGVVTACFTWPERAVPEATTRRLRELIPSDRSASRPVALPGSGVLIPRDGRRLVTAATFTSTKWPRSAAPGNVVVRAFAGRQSDERALGLAEEELETRLLADLGEVLGITDAPSASVIKRWERALPQYVTGHLARIARIEARLERTPTLGVAGAAYHGIGIPACIEGARAAALRLEAGLTA